MAIEPRTQWASLVTVGILGLLGVIVFQEPLDQAARTWRGEVAAEVAEDPAPMVVEEESVEPTTSASAQQAFCGDHLLQRPPEECDDGNGRNGDGCSSNCRSENGSCGDGVVQALLGEQCEPSSHDPNLPYLCTAECRYFSRFCGDDKLDSGEECEAGPNNANTPNASCRMDCSLPRCGDAILDGDNGEQCDDGNRESGDGCDDACALEHAAASTSILPGTVVDLPFNPGTTVPPVGTSIPLPGAYVPQGSPVPQTGPEMIAVMAAGGAAGYAWMRRRRT